VRCSRFASRSLFACLSDQRKFLLPPNSTAPPTLVPTATPIFLICSRSCVRDHSLRHRHSCGPVRRFRSGHLVAIKLDSTPRFRPSPQSLPLAPRAPCSAIRLLALQHYFRHIEKNFQRFRPRATPSSSQNKFLAARRLQTPRPARIR